MRSKRQKREDERMKHYLAYIEEAIHHNADAVALTDYQGLVSYTYAAMAKQVSWLICLFEQVGLRAGDKVAICGRNCANWGIAYLAIAAYRGVAVSILPEFTGESIHNLVTHSDAKLLFVGPWVKGRIDLDQMPQVSTFVSLVDFACLGGATVYNREQVDNRFDMCYPDGFKVELFSLPTDNMDDVALINYTSGSTGSPKGVMVTHKNLSANVVFGQTEIPNDPTKRIVSMLPLAHMFGLMFEFLYQLAGGTHIYFITTGITPALLTHAFAEVKPYMILTVPLVIEKIFKKSIFPVINKPLVRVLWNTPFVQTPIRRKVYRKLMQAFGGKLEYLIIGGAALNKDVEHCLRQIHFPYTCGYGMTECAPLLCYADYRTYQEGSCGRVITGMQLRIDSRHPFKVEGEVQVKGDGVMRGYYKNLQATDNIFTEDGWMRTGDIGIMDKRGNVYLRGRSKNMILGASGQNIYPEEIEDKLNSLDGVTESVVVERDGRLVALVYADNYSQERDAAIREQMKANLQHLNELLPSYSKVSGIELVPREFEKTPKKSIKRYLYK